MKKIAILGSTGSIGTQTLEIVRENMDLQVVGLVPTEVAAVFIIYRHKSNIGRLLNGTESKIKAAK